MGPVCKTDLLQSADTKRESHTAWMRVSLCMSVLSFIHLCTYSIRSSLCHMPPVIRGHSASRERVVHPTHEWCSSHAASERGSSAYRDPESSRTKRLDKHDPQTNARGLIPMTACKGCLVRRMKTKTFSFTPRDTVMDDVNADHMRQFVWLGIKCKWPLFWFCMNSNDVLSFIGISEFN